MLSLERPGTYLICRTLPFIMSLLPNSISERRHYVFWLSVRRVRSSGHGQILLPRYLRNGLRNLDKTFRENWLVPTDDLIRFWRSRSQQAVEVINSSLKVMFCRQMSKLFIYDIWISQTEKLTRFSRKLRLSICCWTESTLSAPVSRSKVQSIWVSNIARIKDRWDCVYKTILVRYRLVTGRHVYDRIYHTSMASPGIAAHDH